MQFIARNVEPVLEEFIPLNNKNENNHSEEDGDLMKTKKEKDSNNKDKKNWMSSVQLWNTDDGFSNQKVDIKVLKKDI